MQDFATAYQPDQLPQISSYQSNASESPSNHNLDMNNEKLTAIQTSYLPQIHLFRGQVILNPTISKINFVAMVVFAVYLGPLLIPVGLLQLPLLNIVYGLSHSAELDLLGVVEISQLLIKMFTYPFLARMSDKYGRKPLIIIGVFIMNIALFVLPNLPRAVPYYVFAQILQDFGMTCILVCPLLADFIDYETKGRVAGINHVLGSLLSFATSSVTANVDLQGNMPLEIHCFAAGGFLIGIAAVFGLKGGTYHRQLAYDRKAEEAEKRVAGMIQEEKILENNEKKTMGIEGRDLNGSLLANNINPSLITNQNNQPQQSLLSQNGQTDLEPGFKAGIREAKRSPWILCGYISNFLFMGCIMLVNVSLVNWATAVTGVETDAKQAYNLTNKQLLVQAIFGFLFGFCMDKYNKFKIIIFVIFSSIIAIILLVTSPSPYHFMSYLSMVFFGIALSGYTIFVSQVTSKYATPKYRASVSALSGMCSLIGGMTISIIGTVLSQYNPYIPFYIYLGSSVVGFGVLTCIYMSKRDILSKL